MSSALFGAVPYAWDKGDQGKRMGSGRRMNRDLVRKSRLSASLEYLGVKSEKDACSLMWYILY